MPLSSAAVDGTLANLFKDIWVAQTSHLCSYETYRQSVLPNETVNANIISIRSHFESQAKKINASLNHLSLELFQWARQPSGCSTHTPTDEQCISSKFWVFGFRVGAANATRKLSLICHLDTVPADPTSKGWEGVNPFEPVIECRKYSDEISPMPSQRQFLVGRGTIDDKGPAVSAWCVLVGLALGLDKSISHGNNLIPDTQIEIIFDTSEETEMSTPLYLADLDANNMPLPDFGVVYDAMWCVRAEKGGERPEFWLTGPTSANHGIYMSSLLTSDANSTNTIPDYAVAQIRGDPAILDSFAREVDQLYASYEFDPKEYRRARMESNIEGSGTDEMVLTITTFVEGAQHGSAPNENLDGGSNPLVSLANFMAGMLKNGRLQNTRAGQIALLIEWMWGTTVFGEKQDGLEAYDEIFEYGNGTTHGVTKVERYVEDGVEYDKLCIDIRYALDHHERKWDGTEGQIRGDSILKGVFEGLVEKFNTLHPWSDPMKITSETLFGPDIRDPNNDDFKLVSEAYEMVTNKPPTMLAIGGGTDAKGHTFLLAVGPLFNPRLGPPINYHGIGEGAPITALMESTKILFATFALQIEKGKPSDKVQIRNLIRSIKKEIDGGRKFCCNH